MSALDLLVIGGGITGLGIARLAARNGYRVALLERGDLAAGTSSVSSHMLHGGLRYLEHGRFALVRESLAERWALSRMAPALARPRRFLAPLYRGDRLRPWKLRAGLQLYDWLAGRAALAPHAMVRAGEALALEPDLAPAGLLGAGLYSDAVMDDARLAIAVARDAAAHGAAIHTYTELTCVRPAPGGGFEVEARDRLEGTLEVLQARTLVNAAGPWADEVRQRLQSALRPGTLDPLPLLRPSRGIHLIFPALTRDHALVLTARADGRVFFVVPMGEHSLVGTTEVEVPSPPRPDSFHPSFEEIQYLCAEVRRVLPSRGALAPLAVTAGVRPLLESGEAVGEASREHRVIDEEGILTVAGGKYTTFRVMARDALVRVARRLHRPESALADPIVPLPSPLAGAPSLEALAEFAIESEFARRVEDVLRRRSALWLAPDRGCAAARVVARMMAARLGWSAERARDEIQAYDAALGEERALLLRAREAA